MQTDCELIAQIKLYYDLQLPENAAQPAPLLIAIHGYAGNKRAMMREAQNFAPGGFAIAALQGFHQHWRESAAEKGAMPKVGFAWLTNYKAEDSVAVHHQAVMNLIENEIASGAADKNKIFLLGFSQSCALNFRFAFANPGLLAGVIGISGGIPGDWETSEIYQTLNAPVLYVYGDTDEFYQLEKFNENAEKLKLRATNLTTKPYAAKHEISAEMRAEIKIWLEKF